jgi:DNA-binding NarL/FixJ family response regulator
MSGAEMLRRGEASAETGPVPEAVSLLLVDESRLYREALADLLRAEAWVTGVDVAVDGRSALEREVVFPPTVTLLNLAVQDSLSWLRALREAGARVVVLGVPELDADVLACAEAGAAGYLLRGDSLPSLLELIRAVARGETICSPHAAALLLRRVATFAAERRSRNGLGLLTAREAEILELLEEGLANSEIAQCLSIQVRTVKNHVHAILGKLEVSRRGQAVARARAARAPVGRI